MIRQVQPESRQTIQLPLDFLTFCQGETFTALFCLAQNLRGLLLCLSPDGFCILFGSGDERVRSHLGVGGKHVIDALTPVQAFLKSFALRVTALNEIIDVGRVVPSPPEAE
jgi:hypothetical protein